MVRKRRNWKAEAVWLRKLANRCLADKKESKIGLAELARLLNERADFLEIPQTEKSP